MKRRAFIKTTVAAAGLGAVSQGGAVLAEESEGKAGREFYELRLFHLRRGPKQKLFDDFFREAALPALNRQGIEPVGVFSVMAGPDSPTMYVLLRHGSLASFESCGERLSTDAEFQKAGAAFLNVPATDPAYIRMESSLLSSFSGFPKLEVPGLTKGNRSRLFELRTYESHSHKANKKKVEMFNRGEIEIFRRAGLQPVFFGETLIGSKLPNLTYMLVFENMAAREVNWGKFASDPEWKSLSATPGYTDAEIVSNISNLFLRPAPYSQI